MVLEGQDLSDTDYNSKIWARRSEKMVKKEGKFGVFEELSQKCKEEAVKLISRVEYPEKRVKYPVNQGKSRGPHSNSQIRPASPPKATKRGQNGPKISPHQHNSTAQPGSDSALPRGHGSNPGQNARGG